MRTTNCSVTVSSEKYGTFKFVWNGGAYIDVSRKTGSAFGCINVFDYVKSEPTIGKIPGVSPTQEVRKLAREWVRENAEDYAVAGGY
jgi:hypothetical protein